MSHHLVNAFGSEFPGMETDNEVETGEVFRPMCLTACKDLGCGKVLEVPVISDNVDQDSRALKVMSPTFEGFKNCEELFVMNIIVAFGFVKCLGMECNWVQVAGGSRNGKDGGECIVRGVSLDCNGGVRDPMCEDRSCSESLLECIEGETALIGKVPYSTLAGETCEQ